MRFSRKAALMVKKAQRSAGMDRLVRRGQMYMAVMWQSFLIISAFCGYIYKLKIDHEREKETWVAAIEENRSNSAKALQYMKSIDTWAHSGPNGINRTKPLR